MDRARRHYFDGFVAVRPAKVSRGETDDWMKAVIKALRKVIKRRHYLQEVMMGETHIEVSNQWKKGSLRNLDRKAW